MSQAKVEKPGGKYRDIYIEGNDEDGWVLYYTGTNNKQLSMGLENTDYASAKSEAAAYLGVLESEVEDG